MARIFKTSALAFAFCLTAVTGAKAETVSSSVDMIVSDCVHGVGIRGDYFLTKVKISSIPAYSVPQGGSVSAAQSQRINQCITQSVKVTRKAKSQKRTAYPVPRSTAACLAEYRHKLSTTNGGRTYRGENAGTRLVAGLFGKRMGRRLIEHEYDRCLNRIAYLSNRCPTGVFVGGAGYCVKRPY